MHSPYASIGYSQIRWILDIAHAQQLCENQMWADVLDFGCEVLNGVMDMDTVLVAAQPAADGGQNSAAAQGWTASGQWNEARLLSWAAVTSNI